MTTPSVPAIPDLVKALRDLDASRIFATPHGFWGHAADALEELSRLKAGEGCPYPCNGKEQLAFEAWAKGEHYEMHEHPLHYIFLDPKTDAARMGWNACIKWMRETMTLPPAPGGRSDE